MARGKRKRKESTSSNSSSPQSGNSDTQASVASKSSGSASHMRNHSKQKRNQASTETDRVAREASSGVGLQRSLENFQTYIDNKFESLTANITQYTTERVSKRLKHSTYDLKFKGNKNQFNFNQDLMGSTNNGRDGCYVCMYVSMYVCMYVQFRQNNKNYQILKYNKSI